MTPKLLLVALAVVLVLWLTAACSSLSKEAVARGLEGIPKNRPVVEHGLETRVMELVLEGERRREEVTYLHAGPEGAPRLVFVHGTPGTLHTWSRVLFGEGDEPGLATDHEVWAPEIVGHGVARARADAYGFQVCADWLSGFLDAEDLRDVVLVANSYGGEFAWRCALDRPDRVRGLVLMSSAGYAREDDEWLPEEEAMRDVWGAKWGWILNSRERIEPALALHFSRPVPDELDEMYFCCGNAGNWGAMVELARDENGDRQGELPNLTQPTLLLWGSEDVAYPVETFARRFERDLPNARLELVEGSGHYPQEEFPVETARAIRAFVRSLPPSTPESR